MRIDKETNRKKNINVKSNLLSMINMSGSKILMFYFVPSLNKLFEIILTRVPFSYFFER